MNSLEICLPMAQMRGEIKQHIDFTQYHLESTEAATKQAVISKKDNLPFFHWVSTAIVSSVSSLEANINNMIVVARDQKLYCKSKHYKTLSNYNYSLYQEKNLFKELLSKQKPKSLIKKYKTFLFLAKNKELEETSIIQDVKFLIQIRDNLIHYKPEFDSDLLSKNESKQKNLEKLYKGQFELNKEHASSPFFLPHKCLSPNCAEWSRTTTLQFIKFYQSQFQ